MDPVYLRCFKHESPTSILSYIVSIIGWMCLPNHACADAEVSGQLEPEMSHTARLTLLWPFQ